jgi:hypothetical protein
MASSSITSTAASVWAEMAAEESKERARNASKVKVGFLSGRDCHSSKDKAKKVSKKKAAQDKKDKTDNSKVPPNPLGTVHLHCVSLYVFIL